MKKLILYTILAIAIVAIIASLILGHHICAMFGLTTYYWIGIGGSLVASGLYYLYNYLYE